MAASPRTEKALKHLGETISVIFSNLEIPKGLLE
jgi:hypothetical protein